MDSIHEFRQRTLTARGSITVRLVYSLIILDSTEHLNILLFLCSKAAESNQTGDQPYSYTSLTRYTECYLLYLSHVD